MTGLFTRALKMAMVSGWIVLPVCLLRHVLRRCPKKYTVCLWALVAVRLVCPVTVHSSLSLIPQRLELAASKLATLPLGAIWFVGMGAMLLLGLFRLLRLTRRLKEAVLWKDNVWVCDYLPTPFVLGVLRPKIYLPSCLTPEDAQLVLDNGFIQAFLVTILWTIVNMVLQLIIAFLLANLLNLKRLRLRNLYKTLLIFPWAMPGYVSILLWKTGMFNSQFGLLNQWLAKYNIGPVKWLGSDGMAFLCCTTVNLWLALPFMITIMDGALQSIEKSFYESAVLDGATWLQKMWYITIPMIKPIIAPSVVITTFTTFKQFDILFLLTQQVGAKTGSNLQTILTYAYEKAFITNNYGYSSAISMIIFVILIVFSVLTNMKPKEETD